MVPLVAFVITVASVAADANGATTHLDPGQLRPVLSPPRLTLRRSGLLADASTSIAPRPAWAPRLAQTPSTATEPAAPEPTTTTGDAPSGATAVSSSPSAAELAASAPASAEEPEPDLELLRHRAQLTRVHRALGITTWASMAATTALGTVLAINQRTWFGEGLCRSAGATPVLGSDVGCSGLGGIHEISAFVTVGFYAATGIFALAMPDPEHASQGSDRRASTLRLHKAVAWVHLAGMIAEPILGVLAASNILGSSDDVERGLRTIHVGVGYVTFAALTTAMLLEL